MCSIFGLSVSMAPFAPVLLVVFLTTAFQQVCMTAGDARVSRSDVREVLRGQIDPSFWPTRGRRGGSSEEAEPPFWANRGRGYDSEEEQPPFWGNRGRQVDPKHHRGRQDSLHPPDRDSNSILSDVHKWYNVRKRQKYPACCDTVATSYPMYVEEPQYILLDRRGASDERGNHYWISRGRREAIEKREASLEKLSKEFVPLDEYEPTVQKRNEPPTRPLEIGNTDDTKLWKSLANKIDNKRYHTSNVSGTEPLK